MRILDLPVKKFMKYQSLKNVRRSLWLVLGVLLFTVMSCKKEVITEVTVDAFAQVDPQVKYNDGIYNILFTLQEYPYKETGIRMGTNKTMFYQNKGLTIYPAYQVSSNRYGAFINSLLPNTAYYYQIYVKDSASSKEVYSDLFSFTTNP